MFVWCQAQGRGEQLVDDPRSSGARTTQDVCAVGKNLLRVRRRKVRNIHALIAQGSLLTAHTPLELHEHLSERSIIAMPCFEGSMFYLNFDDTVIIIYVL